MPSPGARPHWTTAGTLLLAIAPQAWPLPAPALQLDGIELQRKRELHATIVGSALAARVRQAVAADASIRAVIDTAIGTLAWNWRRRHAWTLIAKREGAGRRHALIERIELPAMAAFHRQLGDALGEVLPVPPPHVTLYASAGGRGIGVPDPATLARLRVRDVDAAELAGVLP
jgi:hypothetical protein